MRLFPAFKPALSLALCIALTAPGYGQAPALTRIGVAGGVRGAVTAFAPGEKLVGRILTSGQPLYLHEKITTGPKSSLQVMLIDETAFTIGPNSSMILDEFVYDPASHGGKVSATVTNGVFRFVTGQIGHKNPSRMKVKFPLGTMGVRGTIVAGQVSETGTTVVLLGPGPAVNAPGERIGAFNLENAGTTVNVVKPGYGTSIAGKDSAPTPPALMPTEQLHSILVKISPEVASQAAVHSIAALKAPEEASDDAAAEEKPATAKQPPSVDPSPDSATDDSGQTTAGASGDLTNTQTVADLTTDLSATSFNFVNDAAFDAFVAANQASWDDVRSIQSGTGNYSGTGNFVMSSCDLGACAGTAGTTTLFLDINFGAQTVGSAASKVQVVSNDAKQTAINDTVNFPGASFASLGGAATLSGTSGAGTTATISLLNVNGIAGTAAAKAVYSNGPSQGSGNVVAPLTCTSGTCH